MIRDRQSNTSDNLSDYAVELHQLELNYQNEHNENTLKWLKGK